MQMLLYFLFYLSQDLDYIVFLKKDCRINLKKFAFLIMKDATIYLLQGDINDLF